MSEFQVTRPWLMEYQSARKAWTRRQLTLIGVSWPPRKGWTYRVEGLMISEEARAEFERIARRQHATPKQLGIGL